MTAATALLDRIANLEPFPAIGRIVKVGSSELEASGPSARIGAHCEVVSRIGETAVLRAEVVEITQGLIRLVPFGPVAAVRIGDSVRIVNQDTSAPSGAGFAGRAVDALGQPIDGGPPVVAQSHAPRRIAVLDRVSPARPMITGIRAIDGLLTIGHGQRIGILAASGVGKTRLVEQIIRQTCCDKVVVCQIGERGREVEALWSELKASNKAARTSIVAATSDESAPMRVQCLDQGLAIAEYWRDRGEDVLLVVDSITRFAMALREIGLIAGEPPMLRAYTPNVLRELPRVVERCGAVAEGGSITAVFTILSESDDADDPIVEVMKALLDGHIVLARRLAERGHFPAIDINRSISRLFDRLVPADHVRAAIAIRAQLAKLEESRILVESGMYKAGADPKLDHALANHVSVEGFLRQLQDEEEPWSATVQRLQSLAREGS